MKPMQLKNYQIESLDRIASFFSECRKRPVAEVYAERSQQLANQQLKYFDYLNGAPAVCLRVPTGGGKTIIAAAAIKRIDDAYTQTGAPVVVWLTPSDAITTQTYRGLSNPEHPYRQLIDRDFGAENVAVCKTESFEQLSPSDFGKKCIILVATNQTFNITKTSQRTIYSFKESMERFFTNLAPQQVEGLERVTAEEVAAHPEGVLKESDVGQVKYSIANLLHLFHPIIIVDEAHNGRTDTFFKTLSRLNPAACLDLTATPVEKNNIIHSVSAWELKAENMIKLPVILGEHTGGWENCLMEAAALQNRLEGLAAGESDYIRPIVLIQAEQKGREPGPDAVKAYLMETLKIPEAQIAIATGKIKELKDVDLASPQSAIRFVITVEALKEGWDCPFAYVLCGLQPIQSAKDIEQLLGRVLRMPYASPRSDNSLALSYAQIVSEETMALATLLKDRIVHNMGFNAMEAIDLIRDQTSRDEKPTTPNLPHIEPTPVAKPERPILVPLKVEVPAKVVAAVEKSGTGGLVSVKPQSFAGGNFNVVVSVSTKATDEDLKKFQKELISAVGAKEKTSVETQMEDLRNQLAKARHPLEEEPFPAIPLLCFTDKSGEVRVLDRQNAVHDPWNPNLGAAKRLPDSFSMEDAVRRYSLDVDEKRHLTQSEVSNGNVTQFVQRSLKGFASVSVEDLVNGLAARLARPDVLPRMMHRFVDNIVEGQLIGEQGFSVAQIYAARVKVENALRDLLSRNYEMAMVEGFQEALDLACDTPNAPDFQFVYDIAHYPANNVYQLRGDSMVFKKHFYPQIHDLQYLTPAKKVTEEYLCAQAIENCAKVKRWVRNIEKNKYSFRLPLASGYFYPDFVAELTDGRILVVEYKGADRATNADSREKNYVGKLWADHSNGRGLFLFGLLEDDRRRNIAQQIDDIIKGCL